MISELKGSTMILFRLRHGEGHEFTRAIHNAWSMRLSAPGVSFISAHPQGLKPAHFFHSYGTAKAVPFPVVLPRVLSARLKPRPLKAPASSSHA
jgi:hypothetical protein